MKILTISLLLLLGLPALGQSTWRNFFTTNQSPIVDVVAGSNATVQASFIGVNQRRFTVNAVPTAGGQTNWPWQSITNIDQVQIPYASITNSRVQWSWQSITNLQSSQVPFTVITNAPWQYGSANLTNWALIQTNYVPPQATHATNADFASFATNATAAGFVTNSILTNQIYGTNISGTIPPANHATNAAAAGQILMATSSVTAEWGNNGGSITNVIVRHLNAAAAAAAPGANGVRYLSTTFPNFNLAGSTTVGPASFPLDVQAPYIMTNFVYGAASGGLLATTNITFRLYTNGVFCPPALPILLGVNTASTIITNDTTSSWIMTGTFWTNTLSIQISNNSGSTLAFNPFFQCQVIK